jgi:hypothetical protein
MADTVSYDYSKNPGSVYAMSAAGGQSISTITCVVDVPAIIVAAAAEKAAGTATGLTSDTTITADESITIATLPIGFQVLGIAAYVKTGGGTGTIDIGIPASEACFISALSTATAAAWDYSDTDTYSMAASSGWLIKSRASDADNVIVQFNSAETLPVIIVKIWGIDHSDMLNY